MTVALRALSGSALDAALDDLAGLRITVFRDWPYLYDGDRDYERRYLESYAGNDNAILVGAFDGTRLVGAATGTPLEDHAEDFAAPMERYGIALTTCFYCAESVLLPDYRGQGIGNLFFDARETHARDLGRARSVFCGVVRPNSHASRPASYTPLDPFWRKRGYRPLAGAVAHFSWKDVGAPAETPKPLQVWHRWL